MKPAFFSTAFLPPISYMTHLIEFQDIYIEQYETYRKQSFRNRVEFMSANGKFRFSIPVAKIDGNHTLTKDIKLVYHENWAVILWRSLEAAYNSSPFFLFYKDNLRDILFTKQQNLLDLNTNILRLILKWLGIEINIQFTSTFKKQIADGFDFRNTFQPKSGQTNLFFNEYLQVFSDKYGFIPDLSIIDLLFNLGPSSLPYLKNIRKNGLIRQDIQS